MEEIKITNVNHYHHDDFDELNVRLNHLPPQTTTAEIVDDEHNVFLQINPETQEIVGVTIIYADDWFAEIADAFRRGDLNHPDIEFFLRKKIEEWVSERETPIDNEQPLPV